MTEKSTFEIIDYQELLSSFGEDLDLIPDLVDTFLEHSTESLLLIKAAVTDQNFEELIKTAHALKSMVSHFYADPVREILMQLEEKGHGSTFDGVNDLVVELEGLFEKLNAELIALQESYSS